MRKKGTCKRLTSFILSGILLSVTVTLPGMNLPAVAAGTADTTVYATPGNASVFHDTDGDGFGEFEGWGTSLCWWANRLGYSETLTNQAADLFFGDDGLDLNIGRYNVGGGDCVGDTNVPANDKAAFYDLTTDGKKPTYAGAKMTVSTFTSLASAKWLKSDADFGITKGTAVGNFSCIGYVNQIGGTVANGDNLHYTVNVKEAGSYTVKLLLLHNSNTERDIGIRVNGSKTYSADNAHLKENQMVAVSNASDTTIFLATLSDVALNAGDNTIDVGGVSGWAPDYMKMAVIRSGEEGVLSQDDLMHAPHITRSDSAVPGYATDVTKIDTSKMSLEEYKAKFARVDEECGYAWNYDWEADKNQMNVLKAAAKASGNDFISEAFSNSPPYFMTNSGCSSGAADASTDNLRADSYHAFAAYMADVVVHWINEGVIDFQSTSMMNEPDTNYWGANSKKQEGCHFDPGTSQSKILVAFADEIEKQKAAVTDEHTKEVLGKLILSASDETSIDSAITNYGKLSEEAKEKVSRIDTHTYSGSKREQLSETAKAAGMNLWMSEVDGKYTAGTDAGEMTAALGTAKRIMTDLNGLKSSAWILWNAIDTNIDADNPYDRNSMEELNFDKNGGYWGIAIADHNNQEIILTKKYYGMGQFTRYIRPGASIIGTSNSDTLITYDPDKDQVVIVAVNTSAEDKTWKFDLRSFKAISDSVQAIRSSGSLEDGENWADVTDKADISVDTENKNFTASLKGNSITTFIMDHVTYSKAKDDFAEIKEIPLRADMVTGSTPYNNSTTNIAANVVDNDTSTFFDGVLNGYVQIDLGKGEKIGAIGYAPRNGFSSRCNGGSFYGSNDGTSWTKLYTISSNPTEGVITKKYAYDFESENTTFRYIKYAVPDDGTSNCNIAEIKLYTASAAHEQVDKAKLNAAAEDAKKLDPDKYTSESWREYQAILDEAKATLQDDKLMQSDVDEILEKLNAAKAGLVEKETEKPTPPETEKPAPPETEKPNPSESDKPNPPETEKPNPTNTSVTKPKKVSLRSAKVSGKKKLVVKWKKASGVSGYQVQIALKKNFRTGKRSFLITKPKASSATIKKLTSGKKYYVRVRAYKNVTVNKKQKKRFGTWSNVKRTGSVK